MPEKAYIAKLDDNPELIERWLNEQHLKGYRLVSTAGVAAGRITRVLSVMEHKSVRTHEPAL